MFYMFGSDASDKALCSIFGILISLTRASMLAMPFVNGRLTCHQPNTHSSEWYLRLRDFGNVHISAFVGSARMRRVEKMPVAMLPELDVATLGSSYQRRWVDS